MLRLGGVFLLMTLVAAGCGNPSTEGSSESLAEYCDLARGIDDAISRSHLKRVSFKGADRIPAGQLQPGTVLAAQTSSGNLAKLRVVRFRSSEELSKTDSERLRNLKIQAIDNPCHLELEWELFVPPPRRPCYRER